MATSIETLKLMDLGHAISVIRAEIDPLTSTPLEIFLLENLEEASSGLDAELTKAAEGYDLEVSDIEALGDALIVDATTSAELLELLGKADIDTPTALKSLIQQSNDLRAIANDGEDVFARLITLITTAQE